jgi:Protein of unknown function (DUF3343).
MTGSSDGFYVLAFNSTSHSMQTEKKAKELFRISVIPTPRELSNDCGLALKFLDGDRAAIIEFYQGLKVPADLYFLSNEKINGRRRVEKP